MNGVQWTALGIFFCSYVLIVTERLHRLKAALLGICGVLLLQLVEQTEAFRFIDFNTIGLLVGMMIMVGIVHQTGLIQYVAVKAIQASGGNPWRLLVALSLLTAVTSALLDNVTTVLLVGPVALAVCEAMDVDPIPFVFSVIFASNIGGTATLIGDPPNILIGSAAGLSFNDFILNLGPAVLIGLAVMYVFLYVRYGRELRPTEATVELARQFQQSTRRVNRDLSIRVLSVLSLVLVSFSLHAALHLEAATIALSGAALALLVCPVDVDKMVEEVDWVTILFFCSLFMLVGTLEHLGIIRLAATFLVQVVGDHFRVLSIILIWASGFLSAIVDNVPYTAAMIPLVRDIAQLGGMDPTPLWWSLALGACLGGNGTLVGASANLVMAGIAEKGGLKITFQKFLVTGGVVTVLTLATSTLYVFVRYLR